MADGKDGSLEDIKKAFEAYGKPMERIAEAIGGMMGEATKLNQAFVDGRLRLDELNDAAANAAAGVIRLGGSMSQVGDTMIDIAKGAHRNVIATEEQVTKLFAASQILEKSASSLVSGFDEVGIGISQIGENLEKSIDYIKSVGLNAREVMGSVTENMAQMNRFQFDNGVQGLAKMAAQASMLKFDMSKTFDFADRVLDPEEAINMASAFQRLGVSVGNLADPFQLMNQSINDPTGLQNSLARVGEKFTYFDEKTKTFKINPEGVLTLRELAKETGVSAEQLTKSALAAADLDKRVSQINPSLHFDSEEDKQFLANMATMNKEGEYTIQLKDDETGKIETKKLGDITQEEMEKLREQQANAPKTLEDIQTKQLSVLEDIRRAVEAPLNKFAFGVAQTPQIRGNIAGASRITGNIAGAIDKAVPESRIIGEKVKDTFKKIEDILVLKDSGQLSEKDFAQKIKDFENTLEKSAKDLGKGGVDALKGILKEVDAKTTGSSGIERELKKFTASIFDKKESEIGQNATSESIKNTENYKPVALSSALTQDKYAAKNMFGSGTSTVKFGGKTTIVHEFKYPAETNNVSKEVFEKFVNANKEYFASEEFKKIVYEANRKTSKELETTNG
jgi:hypothetical protein